MRQTMLTKKEKDLARKANYFGGGERWVYGKRH